MEAAATVLETILFEPLGEIPCKLRTMRYIPLLLVIILPFCTQPPPINQPEIPGLLQVCGDLSLLEDSLSNQDWWVMLIRHAKKNHPGYCLHGISIVSLNGETVINYTMKSPDRETIVTDSMTYGNHTVSTR